MIWIWMTQKNTELQFKEMQWGHKANKPTNFNILELFFNFQKRLCQTNIQSLL